MGPRWSCKVDPETLKGDGGVGGGGDLKSRYASFVHKKGSLECEG